MEEKQVEFVARLDLDALRASIILLEEIKT
jgi:hypothetical protein